MKRYRFVYVFILAMAFIACEANTDKKTNNTTTTTSNDNKRNGSAKNIVFFGNSLTAGYGLEEPSTEGYVALLQKRLDSLQKPYYCINAGLSGETTAGGLERIEWVISQQAVDIFVLELGGNDALRGIAPASSKKNLKGIIEKVQAKHPSVRIILAGMQAPRNMGKDYIGQFSKIYTEIAQENKVRLIPFLLENVGGVATLNQKDGIHPTAEGNKIICETVWDTLRNEL